MMIRLRRLNRRFLDFTLSFSLFFFGGVQADSGLTGSEQSSAPIENVPKIAIIIDDMGKRLEDGQRIVALPGPVACSFLPSARYTSLLASAAHAAGKEVLLHLPMDSVDRRPLDAGAVTLDMNEQQFVSTVKAGLAAVPHAVGINNHMGSRFTTHEPGMALVLAELKRRGLLFVDSRTSPQSVGAGVARRLAVPFANRDIFLDDVQSREAVAAQLKVLERIATENGHAVAIGHPHDATLTLLEKWLPTLASRGFVLVPVSAIVRLRGKAGPG